jgi:hypothetical protein
VSADAVPSLVRGRAFYQALVDAGVIRKGEFIRRIVIDAEMNEPVKLYTERYGDERLLRVATELDGVQIGEVDLT